MRWGEFEQACPELAALARERFAREQIILLGTVRPDGSARISGVECDFVDGDLMTGMIWRSAKALDLLREDRVTIHSLVPDKAHESENQGDLKLYGRAVEIADPDHTRRYEDAIEARIDWRLRSRTTASLLIWSVPAWCASPPTAAMCGPGGLAARCASGCCRSIRPSESIPRLWCAVLPPDLPDSPAGHRAGIHVGVGAEAGAAITGAARCAALASGRDGDVSLTR
ncbi:MAG: pyridoxamine 5'-phosphate oxidase family protein [Dehalococcoidia bacterium]